MSEIALLAVLTKRLVAVEKGLGALAREPGPAGKDADPVDTQALAQQVLALVKVPEPLAPPTAEEVAALVVVPEPLQPAPPPTAEEVAALMVVPKAADGQDGKRGPRGERGPVGPVPDHEWDGTKLRFQTEQGWGDFVDLQGARGKAGASGTMVIESDQQAIFERSLLVDPSRPVAYAGFAKRIKRMDYTVYPPTITIASTNDLTADWAERADLAYQ